MYTLFLAAEKQLFAIRCVSKCKKTWCKKLVKRKKKSLQIRSEQGSNLRGETPLDFESNALTTRPSLHGESLRSFMCLLKAMFVN